MLCLYALLSGCAAKSEFVRYYPLHERTFSLDQSAKLLEAFDPAMFDHHYSVIGYVSAEQVLRECPEAFGECKVYAADKSLAAEMEQHASKQGGRFVTHTEKRYIRWTGARQKCTLWEQVSTGTDKNGNNLVQTRCASNVKYTVTYDTVVLHGVLWRQDSEFNTSQIQRLNQIMAWQSIVKKYADNCLIISPSVQAENDSRETQGFFRDLILKAHRIIMNEAGLGLLVKNTKLKELYAEQDAPVAQIPCEIRLAPFLDLDTQ